MILMGVMRMYCRKCGNELRDGDEFCSKCGERVSTSAGGKSKISVHLDLDAPSIQPPSSSTFKQLLVPGKFSHSIARGIVCLFAIAVFIAIEYTLFPAKGAPSDFITDKRGLLAVLAQNLGASIPATIFFLPFLYGLPKHNITKRSYAMEAFFLINVSFLAFGLDAVMRITFVPSIALFLIGIGMLITGRKKKSKQNPTA